MVDTTRAERGAFNEDEVLEGDRATPSVAEAGGGTGKPSIWMWVAMGIGFILAVYFLVILPMQKEETAPTVVDAEPVEVDRSQRAVDRTFPGTGFDLNEPEAPQPVLQQPGDEPTNRERALLLQIESLELQLQKAREEAAQRARVEALRLQIEAAQRAEAERVKRLRSDVVIGDFSGGDSNETGPRDLPNEPLVSDEEANAEPEADTPTLGDSADLLGGLGTTGNTGAGSGFPPALLDQLREQGVDLTPGGQQ